MGALLLYSGGWFPYPGNYRGACCEGARLESPQAERELTHLLNPF